jgi:hypothetical protein
LTFATENARDRTRAYWWCEIEGLRVRYGTLAPLKDTVFDGWNPADSGVLRPIKGWMLGPPDLGGQDADLRACTTSIPEHSLGLLDYGDAITYLMAVSDSSFATSMLTAPVTAALATYLPIDSRYADFADEGDVYLDRETIHYTGRTTSQLTGQVVQAAAYSGLAIDARGYHCVLDNERTEEDGYWDGAVITFTSGTLSGTSWTVKRFFMSTDETFLAGGGRVFELETPFTTLPAVGDTYDLSSSRSRVAVADIGASYEGAEVIVTAGTGAGESAYVQNYLDLGATCIVEVSPPFSVALDSTSRLQVTRYRLTGLTRGLYGSTAAAHESVDDFNVFKKKYVGTKVPFLKTRKVTIYENRTGCVEADALVTNGYLSGIEIDNSGTSYVVRVAGLLSILGKKLLKNQHTGELDKPLWGGKLQERWEYVRMENPSGDGYITEKRIYWVPRMEDGDCSDFCLSEIVIRNAQGISTYAAQGNVMVEDEVIHYGDRLWIYQDNPQEFRAVLRISPEYISPSTSKIYEPGDLDMVGCLYARAIMSERIGAANIMSASNSNPRTDPSWTISKRLAVSSLMAEHAIGSEVKRVCVCGDAPYSDFPRFDVIYLTDITDVFTVGELVSATVSGMQARVLYVGDLDGIGFMLISHADPEDYTLGPTEAFTGLSSGATANIQTYTIGPVVWPVYLKEQYPRNNVIDVMLQLLMSSGTVGTNGLYDTLPAGFGLGLSSALVDVASFEAVRDRYLSQVTVDFVIEEPTAAKEFFDEQLLPLAQCYLYESAEGKISCAALTTRVEAVDAGASEDLDSTNLDVKMFPRLTLPEEPIAKMKVKINRKPGTSDHMSEIEIFFGDTVDWYDDRGQDLDVEFSTIYTPDRIMKVSHRGEGLPASIKRMLSILWDRHARYPLPVVEVQTPYAYLTIDIGDVVTLTDPNMPNMRTSARGVSAEYYQVVGRQLMVRDGICRFKLVQIGVHDQQYGFIAPAAEVSAVSGLLTKTVTFRRTRFSAGTTSDLSYFAAGDFVIFYDLQHVASGVAREILTIDQAARQITISALSVAAVGDVMEFADYDSCVASQKSKWLFGAGADHVIGTGGNAFKWM